MRVINVVRVKNDVVDNIESFGVFEEQLVNDVSQAAEKEFLKQAKELGFDDSDEDDVQAILDNGYYETEGFEVQTVCISWSDI